MLACLALAALLAWGWLWAHRMTDMDGMAGMADMPGGPAPLSGEAIGAAFLMWTLMMAAMMLPSATPMILLYNRLARAAPRSGIDATFVFVVAYLAVWTIASLIAATAQQGMVASGLLGDGALTLGDRFAAGGLLIVAGLYQLTPLKRRCLQHCRSPFGFLMSGWRPGWRGALRLGLRHGAYCLGCCWLLMALLFVGGVMNLAWVALLAAIVLAEKALPGERAVPLVVGGLAMAAGVWVMAG